MAAGDNFKSGHIKYNKYLTKINDEYIIERQIRCIRDHHPKASITVVLGENWSDIRKTFQNKQVSIVINHNYHKYGQTYSLLLGLLSSRYGSCTIIFGDLIFDGRIIKEISRDKNHCVYSKYINKHSAGMLLQSINRKQELKVHGLSYGYKPKWGQMVNLVSTQKTLSWCSDASNYNRLIIELIDKLIKDEEPFFTRYHNLYINDVDTMNEFKKNQQTISKLNKRFM